MNNFTLIIFLILIFNVIAIHESLTHAAESSRQSSWITGANMPTPRSEATSALLKDKIYVIGGLDRNNQPLDNMEVYDIKLDSWNSVASLPLALDHADATVYNEKIYLVGGRGFNDTISNKLYIYDPVSNKWEEGKSMPTARYGLTANFVNGTLYVIGGKNTKLMGFAHENLDLNEAYDPKNNTWSSKAPMPTPRHHLTSAVVDGKIYAIGGRHTGIQQVQLNNNEMYDPVNDSWTPKAPMPSERSGIGSARASGGSIYVFGGEICDMRYNSSRMVFNNNERYEPKIDKWTVETSMPTARHGPSVQFVNGSIYVIGGGPEPCRSSTNANEIFLNSN
jgi:N-acetylneuraminic acid mutarotase